MNPVDEDRALDGESDLASGTQRRGQLAMDPTTRHLVFIACGIGLLLLVVIGSWALSGRQRGSIPVIEAASSPLRMKPVDPGGMQAMGSQAPASGAASGVETLAPMPEAARPEALQAEVDAARRSEVQNPPTAAPSAPAPSSAVPSSAPPSAAAQSSAAPADDAASPAGPSAASRYPAGGAPASGTAAHPHAGGPLAVQLAALGSHDAARTEWSRLSRGHRLLFSGHVPEVEAADHGGRRIYRLRTGGFASVSEAHAFCARAHAQRVACTIADF